MTHDVTVLPAKPSPWLPLTTCLVLFVGINVCYVIGASTGHVNWCFPYIDGCTSISRASRTPPAVFVYRATISSTGVLLAFYWIAWARWLTALGTWPAWRTRTLAVLGVVAAICLIANAAILGENTPALRLSRRVFVIGFFVLTFIACAMSATALATARNAGKGTSRGIVRAKFTIVALLAGLGVLNYVVMPLVDSLQPFEDRMENAVEWQWVALLVAYFASTAFAWRGGGAGR